jgi:hypothetical protein
MAITLRLILLPHSTAVVVALAVEAVQAVLEGQAVKALAE